MYVVVPLTECSEVAIRLDSTKGKGSKGKGKRKKKKEKAEKQKENVSDEKTTQQYRAMKKIDHHQATKITTNLN